MTCGVSYDPRLEGEAKVAWKKIGQDSVLSEDRTLLLSNLTLSEAGDYECAVETPFEKAQAKVKLKVSGEAPKIVSGPPAKVKQFLKSILWECEG